MGLNSILIYLLSCTGMVEAALTCFYWGEADNNLSHLFFPTGEALGGAVLTGGVLFGL